MREPTAVRDAQGVLDRLAVLDKVSLYTSMDRRDWDLYRSIFTDEIEISFPETTPAAEGGRLSVDDWVTLVRTTLTAFDHTHHAISNHLVRIEGDKATCDSHMVARHYVSGHDPSNPVTGWVIGGFYEHKLQRIDGEWKICGVKLHSTWEQGADVRDRVFSAIGAVS